MSAAAIGGTSASVLRTLPCGVPRQVLEEVHADILEFRTDQPEAEEENPHVVLRAFGAEGSLVFRARALRILGEGGDGEAEDDVAFDLPGVGCTVEGPNLDRSGPPYVVQVDRMVPHGIVVRGIRVGISEPCLVERFPCGWLGVFQAGDEFAVGAPCVAVDSPLKRSSRLEEEFFLLVENSREVRDLPGVEIADSDVDVLAGAFRSFRSGFAGLAHHRLKGIYVVPFENRGHHLGACGTASEASIADRFPVASVRSDHRPFIVSASGVVDRSADHAVDRFRRPFAADVRVLELRPEGKFLRRLNRVGHFGLRCFAC